MIHYLENVHMGVKGVISDNGDNAIPNAEVKVVDNEKVVRASERGEYWRLLLPNRNYTLVREHPII